VTNSSDVIAFRKDLPPPGAPMGRQTARIINLAEKSDRDVLEVFVDLDETDAWLVVGPHIIDQFGGRWLKGVRVRRRPAKMPAFIQQPDFFTPD
jgi:hypothetical protein